MFSSATMSFEYRATATGPSDFVIRTILDDYISNVATGKFTSDALWYTIENISVTLSAITAQTTFRMNAYNASAGGGTLRVDDVTIRGNVTAIPEPTTYAMALGLVALAGVMTRRRYTPNVTD